MAKGLTPYENLPPQRFWRTGVAESGVFGLSELWRSKWELPSDAAFATYGSCFAQHISRALRARGIAWVEGEPAPMATRAEIARHFNYGVFSARTANIYTVAQLELLLRMALGEVPVEAPEVWPHEGRFRDSLRPLIEPGGFATLTEALASRRAMLRGFKASIVRADVFVFTLGLTEGWESPQGLPYAACPGTLGGSFDAGQHRFVNYKTQEVADGLRRSLALMRRINPQIRLLLTVSPVPLTATASGQHVLLATTWSKSVLRAAAGELCAEEGDVDYFPSFEIITGAMTRSAFFDPNLRTVAGAGVDQVMKHFFAGLRLTAPARGDSPPPDHSAINQAEAAEALACEEVMLERFNA